MVERKGNINTDGQNSFINDSSGNVARNVVNSGGLAVPPHDKITVTYPSDITELYTYSLSAADVATITITYLDAAKTQLSTVVRT